MTSVKRHILPVAALALLAALAYAPALTGRFIWDDADYIVQNQALRSLGGLARIWLEPGTVPQYYPVAYTAFWLQFRFWGLAPAGYHAVNLALHLLNAFLLWRLLLRWKVPGAAWAAALFALHPVQAESVAWITELKNVLSTCFFLAAFRLYWDFREARERPGAAWRPYAAALALYALALGSKTVACVWPVAVLLAVWWKEGRAWTKELRPLAPFFALGVLAGLTTAWLEKHKIGAEGAEWALDFPQRLEIAGRALWFYLGKLAWPADQAFIYPRWTPASPAGWLFPFAFAAVLSSLWRRRRKLGRGPLAALLFFAAALFPALGFFDVYPMRFSFVADHFQYLACAGPLILLAAAVPRRLRPGVLGLALAAFTFLTWRRAHAFRGLEELWRDTLAKNPDAWIAHNNLGFELLGRDRLEEAKAHFRQALSLRPDYPEAEYNLGNAMLASGELAAAEARFRDIVRRRPGFSAAHVNLGNALYRQGRRAEAEASYREALRLRPRLPEALTGLGNVLSDAGRLREALEAYETALRHDPDFAGAKTNMAVALVRLGVTQAKRGDLAAAEKSFNEALYWDPNQGAAAHNMVLLKKRSVK